VKRLPRPEILFAAKGAIITPMTPPDHSEACPACVVRFVLESVPRPLRHGLGSAFHLHQHDVERDDPVSPAHDVEATTPRVDA
jgi:hypothetical protein